MKNYGYDVDSELGRMTKLRVLLMCLTDPLPWIIDNSARSILDLGCGQGKPMAMVKFLKNIDYSCGVDLYRPYINQAKKMKLFNKYLIQDIRKINFKNKSFDVVLASHVLEHLPKKDALKLLDKMENIARKQIVIAAPIGRYYQPIYDGNRLQEHKSYFFPEEFKKRGYNIVRYGMRKLLDEHSEGLVYKNHNPLVRKLIYLLNLLITPIYYMFPQMCDYFFIAYKNID